ncbi:hypothetical protein [Pseudomonas sp. 15A4]|uniref:hypothetical protein n=1 Tax=Pseudomonas sp. 15A4 TaxID=2804761 RepID=UPI0031F60514
MKATLEGFYQEIKRLDRIGMRFAIFRNRKNESANSYELGGTRELRIVPIVSGSGVIQLLSPRLSGVKQSGAPENLTAYAFGSANNTPPNGNPVRICIGRRCWGGAIISASIYAEDKT